MRTTFDFVNMVYAALNGNDALKDAIDGDIYKYNRPVDSRKVDVVINCLPAMNAQLQEAVVNVNIHAPNLALNIVGKQDNTQPDHEKLSAVSAIVIDALKEHDGEDFHCDIERQLLFVEEELHEHYSNIRVQVFSINI